MSCVLSSDVQNNQTTDKESDDFPHGNEYVCEITRLDETPFDSAETFDKTYNETSISHAKKIYQSKDGKGMDKYL